MFKLINKNIYLIALLNEIEKAFNEVLSFHHLTPTKIETNCGSLWFVDKTTKQKYFVLVDKCCRDEE